MIQIRTVSNRTEPSDYWPDEFIRNIEFKDDSTGREREADVARSESVEMVMGTADSDTFIVTMNPQLTYDHPNADARVEIYDGYNE
jgi:hypothetical protein